MSPGPGTLRRRRLRWLALALPVVALALVFAPPARAPLAAGTGCAGQRPGSESLTLAGGGVTRSAWIHIPPAGRGTRPLPLVVALHGYGGSGRFMEAYSGLSGMSDRHAFVVAYPDALGAKPQWNIAGKPGAAPDDVAFIAALIGRLASSGCIDRQRIYATGVSNGGGMTARLGCDLSEELSAIAPVAGGYSKLPPCTPAKPVSVLEIHGTADPIVPYAGKGAARAGSVRGFIRGWLNRDGCRPGLRRSTPAHQVVRLDWQRCTGGTVVAHLKLIGGGHEWPESRPERSDRWPPLSASKEVWRFFSRPRG